jgi:transposase-like protein
MLSSNTIWRKGMAKKTRRRYTAEFKAAAVARLEEPGETLSSVAQALGVAATQVKTWRLEQQAAGSAEAVARRRAEAAELQQLRRDNKRLQEENEILRKASAFFARWAEMKAKLAFISGSTYSIRLLCAVLGVARSWFHDWQAGDQTRSSESRAEADLVGQIRSIFQDSGQCYGAPRVHAELRARGVRIARKRGS